MTSWSELPLTEQHAAYLREQAAITADVAAAAGIRSASTVDELPEHARSWGNQALPAIVFPYRSVAGTVIEQVKPDEPIYYKDEAKPRKYLLGEGSGSILNAVRPDPDASTVLIVEGTKQTYAAASWAGAGVAVYGVAGCRNWSQNGVPIKDLRVAKGRDVVVALDADVEHNLDVYVAGQGLERALKAEGAKSVLFLLLPGGRSTGLDDVLAERDDDEHRRDYLASLIAMAGKLPGRKPVAKRQEKPPAEGDVFFEDGSLMVKRLSDAIHKKLPSALTQERKVALYRAGYFNIDGAAFSGAVSELLGDRFRPAHRAAVEEFTVGTLYNAGLELPTYITQPLLNVQNGMLDLPTSTLKPHDPVYLSSQQIPVAWDPEAACPTYERWIDLCGVAEQLDDLEETVGMMLDPSRTPHKAVFLFGPSRSGKSTFLRLMQAMIGDRNLAAVTLHQLAENRFAAANIFGKMLNAAADLSAAHVEDLSIFKMMTGEDPIQADRKFGNQFAFTNKALFAFSANTPPTIGEGSRAYFERIKPFEFPISFAGRENPEMEDRMIADELPGILVRWVRAWQRRQARGVWLPTNTKVAADFETKSDRVRQWVHERCDIHTTTAAGKPVGDGTVLDNTRCSTKRELGNAFAEWASENNGAGMGQRKVIERLLQMPGVHLVRNAAKAYALNVTARNDGDGLWPDDELPQGEGGGFEAEVAVSGGETATSGAETATSKVQVSESGVAEVAKVAVSSPPVAHLTGSSERRARADSTEGDEDGVETGFAAQCSETATFATTATSVLHRPGLDRVEQAMASAGAEQLDLLGGDAVQPSSPPQAPRRRVARPGDGLTLTRSAGSPVPPVDRLLPPAEFAQTCPHCRSRKQLVPPTNFWYACAHCYPATFGA